MGSEQSNIEPLADDDKLVLVRFKARDWATLIGPGLDIVNGRLQLIQQPVGNVYGLRLESRS